MRSTSTSFSLLAMAFVALHTQSASAQTAPSEQSAPISPSTQSAPSTFDLHLDAQVGTYGGREGLGVMVGALVLVRASLLEAGAEGQIGSSAYDYSSLGGLVGLGFDPADHWRLDLLGEVGVESYDRVGHAAFNPGASAVRHYAGGRVAIMRRAGIFEIGYAAGFTSDFDSADTTYAYEGGSWLGGPHAATGTTRIGTYRLTGALTLGAAFDL